MKVVKAAKSLMYLFQVPAGVWNYSRFCSLHKWASSLKKAREPKTTAALFFVNSHYRCQGSLSLQEDDENPFTAVKTDYRKKVHTSGESTKLFLLL